MDNKEVLDAIHTLEKEMMVFRAQSQTEHKHLKEIISTDYTELKNRVDTHGRQIDNLNITVARNKESSDASMRSAKMFGAIIAGFLVFIEVAVVTAGILLK